MTGTTTAESGLAIAGVTAASVGAPVLTKHPMQAVLRRHRSGHWQVVQRAAAAPSAVVRVINISKAQLETLHEVVRVHSKLDQKELAAALLRREALRSLGQHKDADLMRDALGKVGFTVQDQKLGDPGDQNGGFFVVHQDLVPTHDMIVSVDGPRHSR